MQFEAVFEEAGRKHIEETACVGLVLANDHEVVGKPHQEGRPRNHGRTVVSNQVSRTSCM